MTPIFSHAPGATKRLVYEVGPCPRFDTLVQLNLLDLPSAVYRVTANLLFCIPIGRRVSLTIC